MMFSWVHWLLVLTLVICLSIWFPLFLLNCFLFLIWKRVLCIGNITAFTVVVVVFFCHCFLFLYFTILYWFFHTSTCIRHGCTRVPNPEPHPTTSLLIPSLWVIPVHQPQASCILHQTWTGDSFLIWYYTCFNAILPNYPPPPLSHRVQKTLLYISVFFAVSHTGLSLSSF